MGLSEAGARQEWRRKSAAGEWRAHLGTLDTLGAGRRGFGQVWALFAMVLPELEQRAPERLEAWREFRAMGRR